FQARALHFDAAGVGAEQAVQVLEQHALAAAAAAEQDERLAVVHLERHAAEHRLAAELLLDVPAADERLRHERRKSFVKKKSATRIVIEAATTVAVVARPTPSAPPVT